MTSPRLAMLLPLALCLVACPGPRQPGQAPVGPPGPAGVESSGQGSVAAPLREGEQPGGPPVVLSEGERGAPEAPPRVPRADVRPLDEAAAERLLARLPALPPAPAADFARREGPPPPARTGETTRLPFPPPAPGLPRPDGPAAEVGPLEVTRYQPEDDVALVPHVSIGFSRPMIPLGTAGAAVVGAPPARLEPQPPGRWRWVGTQTLLFEPQGGRFPAATEYRVTVPAGASTPDGVALAREVAWSFRTPPPTVQASGPRGGPQGLEPLCFVVFDQRVDPAAVLPALRARAGDAPVALRLASAEEAAALASPPDRTVAFRPASPLPRATAVSIEVGPGVPSAEGPRTSTAPVRLAFQTYGAHRVTEHRAGWGRDECPPGAPFWITFANPLDPEAVTPERVQVTPAIPGLALHPGGRTLQLRGMTKANTTYTVTLDPGLRDVFGQALDAAGPLTFRTTAPEPQLLGPGDEHVVVDPAGPARVVVRSIGIPHLRARVLAVDPAVDVAAFERWRDDRWASRPPALPGKEVASAERAAARGPDDWSETAVDLGPALEHGLGHALVVVEPRDWPDEGRHGRRPQVVVWAQVTRLALDLQADADEALVHVTGLADGRAAAGAEVSIHALGKPDPARSFEAATADADGLARLKRRAYGSQGALAVVVRRGADTAFVLAEDHVQRQERERRWFTFDDRHLYRPGEELRLKGWLREVGLGEGGDLQALRLGTVELEGARSGRDVDWRALDARGTELAKGTARLDAHGGFDLAVALPGTAHVGDAQVVFDAGVGAGHAHAFRIAEFRRPEYEVTVGAASDGPYFTGGEALVRVGARYFAGGALPAAPVRWAVRAARGSYAPPGREGWTFGEHVPWWLLGRGDLPGVGAEHSTGLAGLTDGQGEHLLRLGLRGLGGGEPMAVTCEATVQDVNRQAWSATTALLVHPADTYVGLRAARPFFGKGEPLAVEALAVDLDGAPAAGRKVEVVFERLGWRLAGGRYEEVVAEAVTRSFTSEQAPLAAQVEKPAGGTWRVVARVEDAAGRVQRSALRVWVAGGAPPPAPTIEEERVTLVPSAAEYAAGDVAEVLVVAPFPGAEGLFTLRRSGIVRVERLRLEGSTTTLRIPIEEGHVPDLTVHVALVGQAPWSDAPAGQAAKSRPAFAAGQLTLPVPPRSRTLHVAVAPAAATLAPGAETAVEVVVRDAQGAPVPGAQVALAVVDEAVLMLAGHARPDPLGAFYAPRGPGQVTEARSRALLRLDQGAPAEDEVEPILFEFGADKGGAPEALMARGDLSDLGGGGGGAGAPPIALRADLRALAAFAPALVTDAQGAARFTYRLPDSLTRYRLVAVAAGAPDDPRRFGAAEAVQTARLALQVRPSAPRFLNFGDAFELPLVVQNQTDAPLEVELAARASNLTFTAGAGRRLTVPARDRREVRLPAAAARAGVARLQVAVAATGPEGALGDAQQLELPVWTPATAEAFATYGVLDGDGALAHAVTVPEAWPEHGGLELTASSTALQALTDAVIYLAEYPHGCAEQVASRVLALAAVRDVLAAFAAPGLPPPAVLEAKVAADLTRLGQLQNPDGGWGFWRPGEPSWPFLTCHVAHALARAKQKGYAVDAFPLQRASRYLRRIERHLPAWYSPESKRALQAYALHARAQLGDADPGRAKALLAEAGGPAGLSLEALGWLWPLLRKGSPADAQAVRRHLANRLEETAGAAHFTTAYSDGAHVLLHSARRVDGVVLEALLDDPAEVRGDLAPKLVAGLLAHKTRGRWQNTQENAFVLLALDRYFRAAEGVTPDFVARAWLGDAFAGEVAFRGRTTERQEVAVPMPFLQARGGAATDLLLAKSGPGRLYYRLGLRYAPRDLALGPLERGFTVERAYEAVDDPADVRRQEDGSWRVRAGARVRVRLTMMVPARRYHVALVDPLPAGLEPLDPGLAATGALPADPGNASAPGRGGCWWWSRTWYEHAGLRDERAEAFTSLLWEGVHTHSYVARATTPGRFVVPPAKAEEMYAPETFGRSGSDVVVVAEGE